MRTTRRKGYANPKAVRRGESPLTLAVRLTLSQLSNGIGLAEAIQFAARYHDITCAAIQTELAKSGRSTRDGLFLPKLV